MARGGCTIRHITVSPMINTSQELQNVIDGKARYDGTIYLASGTYDVAPSDKYYPVKIESSEPTPYSVRINVHDAPLTFGHYSRIRSVTLTPMGDFYAVRADHSSRAKFIDCIFRSRQQDTRDKHTNDHEAWNTIEREGGGIETTTENIGDDAWGIWIQGCLFQALKVGIRAGEPGVSPIGVKERRKGTLAWKVLHNDFDACEYAIDGIRMGEWHITGGLIQLHRVGIRLDGMCNWIRDVGFERGADKGWDIQFSNQSCHNRVRDVTAQPHRVNSVVKDRERDNIYSWVQKRAIWRPCNPDDEKERIFPD